MKHTLVLCICLLAFASVAYALQETVTVSKEEFDALKARVADLEQKLETLLSQQPGVAPAAPVEPGEELLGPPEIDATAQPEPAPSGGGRQLALPDISLIVQAKGRASGDSRDADRNKLLLSEAELGIQGYVYPNVKADAFITGAPAEDEAAEVEEAYLTYLGLRKGLNVNLGKKFVSFGRTNFLHNHSWLYARQPLVISNFVAPESLSGQGVNVSYLFPTKSKLFAQVDLGLWANGGAGEQSDLPDILSGPGANLTDRFNTARLWTGYPIGENSELELGGSWAAGKSVEDPVLGVDRVHLSGVDLTYRRFGEGSKRLLLRGEGFRRRGTTDSNGDTAKGYYLFGNYRPNKYSSLGLLYDWSEFPRDAGLHESALSFILTKQFSEQYYVRLQAIHGSRPGDSRYDELWLHWVWGVGPHTHNLE